MKLRHGVWIIGLVACAFFVTLHLDARASQMSYVSDTISDSRPSFGAEHTILFNVPDAIPASGKLIFSFDNSSFSVSVTSTYNNMIFSYSTSSPISGFTNRTLGFSAGPSTDGVSIAIGTGAITITLASGSGIPAGSYVRLAIGASAPAGINDIVNPSVPGPYRVRINTYDVVSAPIDYGTAMAFILQTISVQASNNRSIPPVLSNGLPTGTIPSNVSGVLVSFNTDIYATCRYATTSGVSYDAMTNSAAQDFVGMLHTFIVSGISNGTTYSYFIRCSDIANNTNTIDYVISFTGGNPTGVPPGGGPYGSQTSGGGGGGAPYPPGPPAGSLIIKGVTFPSASVYLLRDGTTAPQGTTADNDGNFTISISSIDQGVYSFTLYINDANGNRISSRTFTMTIVLGTSNSVVGLVMPPTIGLATSTVAPGKTVLVSGQSSPFSTIELTITSQVGLQSPVIVTTTTLANGLWSYPVNTKGFSVDTYQVKARASVPGLQASNDSNIAFLGVGQKPVPLAANADLNGDGKVNLVDFSIMLYHWGQNYPPADLNLDGTVDLPDFSILLFHWTG